MRLPIVFLVVMSISGAPAWAEVESPGSAASIDLIQPASLPLSKVILYSSGVGYFQHDGTVQDQAHIDLHVKTDSINDLLKSMVVRDPDGGIPTVTYSSHDPIAKALSRFGIDLSANPTLGQLLNQIRGERIDVATPNSLIGTIVGIEHKEQALGSGDEPRRPVVRIEYLTLLTEDGLRSIPMSQIQRVKLLNPQLNQELEQALSVLAAGHNARKKTVSIVCHGQGTRNVHVAYIMEAPVWKTAYRLIFQEDGRAYLQGWAIIENTTDADWSNVSLSLISGRPISFTMDLYQPLYATRPTVVPELYASLRPRVYGDAMDEERAQAAREGSEGKSAASPESKRRGRADAAASLRAPAPAAPAPQESKAEAAFERDAAAHGYAAGELFEYRLTRPVSLRREASALLPIIGQAVEAYKLSIYNRAGHPKHPFNGARLKNTTPLHVMQGPVTVFDAEAYAGDARLDDLAPGQDRLISYALDLKIEVEPKTGAGQEELLSVAVRKGTLTATRKLRETTVYQVRNRDRQNKMLLIEHPYRAEWRLSELLKPTERTREVYRFAVQTEAGKTGELTVVEEKQIQQTVHLLESSSDMIAYYLQAKQVGPAVREALQRVTALRDRLNQTTSRRDGLEQRVREIGQEQSRIRENMTRLPQNSDLYTRYVKKLDQQETEIDQLRKEIASLKAAEQEQKRELNDYLLSLDLG